MIFTYPRGQIILFGNNIRSPWHLDPCTIDSKKRLPVSGLGIPKEYRSVHTYKKYRYNPYTCMVNIKRNKGNFECLKRRMKDDKKDKTRQETGQNLCKRGGNKRKKGLGRVNIGPS
jgi:hypothetical protein